METGQVVLRIDEREPFTATPILSRNGPERAGIRVDAGPAVQLISRDSFVAETAAKIEQMQATIRLLTRDVGELSRKVSDLHDTASQDHRWHAYQESERRARETKLEETLRCCRDLKARLDRIEPRTSGDYHAYNSFEAVSRKLAELEQFRDAAQKAERHVTLKAWLFCGTLVLAASILVASHVLAG